MFFDDHPRFLSTSEVAADRNRLNLRHEAIIEQHLDLIRGARVLDLASHDGRWTLAALEAGAASVVGVEARPELVQAGIETFDHYGADRDRYRLVQADVFDYLRDPGAFVDDAGGGIGEEFDLVMCLGFFYHTWRHTELLSGIAATDASNVIVDTRTIADDVPHVRIIVDDVDKQGHAVADPFSPPGAVLTGTPSRPALRRMFSLYGYEVFREVDWEAMAKRRSRRAIRAYLEGRRVTWSFSRVG